ncbi:MAG: hypothetical protein QUS14_08630 [Pyrinomonadaceae bacterium]|nr:hypothetical protein [Pyrinomonadaceae bacterium]
MRILTITLLILAAGIFAACTQQAQQPPTVADSNANFNANTDANLMAEAEPTPDLNDYWARDNFDLARAGTLLERSNSPQEFERYINEPDGINNLDLNGDGYADYISVQEFGGDNDLERGLSLFARYGPDLIQDIATIFLYRDEPRYPGARMYIRGDDRIYGDDYYYQTNWLDRTLGVVNALFGDRDYYRSPYNYYNHPDYYEPYYVVETPYYRDRIVEIYPQPAFVFTRRPEFWDRIKIKSPNNGLHLGQIKARFAKPTKEQEEWYRANPGRPAFAKPGNKGGVYGKGPDRVRDEKTSQDENPGRGDDKREDRPGKDVKPQARPDDKGRGSDKPGKPADQGNPNKGGGKPEKGKP